MRQKQHNELWPGFKAGLCGKAELLCLHCTRWQQPGDYPLTEYKASGETVTVSKCCSQMVKRILFERVSPLWKTMLITKHHKQILKSNLQDAKLQNHISKGNSNRLLQLTSMYSFFQFDSWHFNLASYIIQIYEARLETQLQR